MKHQIFSRLKIGVFPALVIGVALAALLAYLLTGRSGNIFSAPKAQFQFTPYLDLNLAIEGGLPLRNTFFSANTKSIIAMPDSGPLQGLKALTLAFAIGECGKEHWAGLNADQLAAANVQTLQQADVGYMIATGGADDVFTCDSEAGMEAFIQRYQSSHLLGFDFNIERNQTEQQINHLVRQVGLAMQRHPKLRYSFTLAALASNTSAALNPTGQWVMNAVAAHGLRNYYINLMVMNYGVAQPGTCVMKSGQCDMAASAIRAVNNLSLKYHLPLERIEVTPMIGINDVSNNVFTLDDAQKLVKFAKTYGLGGVHFWSLNRDMPCPQVNTVATPYCHGLTDAPRLAFTTAFAQTVPLAATQHTP